MNAITTTPLADRFERMMAGRQVPPAVRAALLEAFMAGAAAHDQLVTQVTNKKGDKKKLAQDLAGVLDAAAGEILEAKAEAQKVAANLAPRPPAHDLPEPSDKMHLTPIETDGTNAIMPNGHGGTRPLPVYRFPGGYNTHWCPTSAALNAMRESPHLISCVVAHDGSMSMRVMPVQTVRTQ
ncbi:MAG: hypothetical protein AAFR68_04210 [Pseudomonadota bacterium]